MAKASGTTKPNILVIFGDDIGIPQVSAYTRGLMGYQTPNIDRIADKGALFTDSYGLRSCTADFEDFPYQSGSSLNAGEIGYGLLRRTEAMKRLKSVEGFAVAGGGGR